MRPYLIILLAMMGLSSCGNPFAPDDLSDYVRTHRTGKSADQWLELRNAFGEWERVALVTGYWDDQEACENITEALTSNYGRQYRCVVAN